MNLIPKLIISVLIVVLAIVGSIGAVVVSKLDQELLSLVSQSLRAEVNFALGQVKDTQEDIASLSQVTAKNRKIAQALTQLESRGVSRELNDLVKIYPFINYILIVDKHNEVFATSTRDPKGQKVNSEQFLLESVTIHPLYQENDGLMAQVGSPSPDPYLARMGKKASLSQWYASPIVRRGEVIGQVILATNWDITHKEALRKVVRELRSARAPVQGAFILDSRETIVSSALDFAQFENQNLSVRRYQENQLFRPGESSIWEAEFISIGDTKYEVAVLFDRDETRAKTEELIRFIAMTVFIGAILLAIVFYVMLKYTFIDRLIAMLKGTRSIAAGKQDKLLVSGEDELAVLGDAMNKMIERLKESTISIDHLNEEVALRKRMHEEFKEQNERFKLAADSAEIGIWELDLVQGTLKWDDWMLKLFGKQRSEFQGGYEDWASSLHPDDKERAIAEVEDALKGNKPFNTVFRILWPNGETRHIKAASIIRHNEEGEAVSMVGVNIDVTESERHAALMSEATRVAESAAEAKSSFLASMSHEIRTPLNGVLGMLGILGHTELNDQQKHQVRVAESSANSLLALINDILDFSKVDAGKLELETIDFNLIQMLGDFAESMVMRSNERDVELILDTQGVTASVVQGDPGRIRQILSNLVGNALKFTTKGEILIKARLVDKDEDSFKLEIAISDTGIGIAEDKIETLFDAFTQADSSTTRQYGGTGLGLSISRKLCELMNGSIWVSSELGKGSKFTFDIEVLKSEQSFPICPEVDIGELEILIVDDNEANRQVLVGQLGLWGATVVPAEHAEQALSILNTRLDEGGRPFDIALLDFNMPGMNGAELGKRIRQDARLDTMPLVMMSSMSHRGDAKFYSDLGFQGYFPKPVTMDDLFKAIAVVSEQGESMQKADPLVTRHYLHSLSTEDAEDDSPWGGKVRILLVEDNVVNQLVAKGILQGFGLDADVAANGIEALETLKKFESIEPYDVVLMDCLMPEMDGYQATAAIRKGEGGDLSRSIPIIAMTANAMKGDREKCIEAGMDDYVSKPVVPDDLETVLRKWLKRDKAS